MNTLDLIFYLILIIAVWNGWRKGFIVQLISIVGFFLAIYLAARYGEWVGEQLSLDTSYAHVGGFAITLVGAWIGCGLLSRFLHHVFKWIGFGFFDTLLGILLSVVKYLIIASLLFSVLARLNIDYNLIKKETIEQSKHYEWVKNLSSNMVPYLEKLEDKLPTQAQETLNETKETLKWNNNSQE